MHFKKPCKCILLITTTKNCSKCKQNCSNCSQLKKYLLVHFKVGLQNYAHFRNMNYGTTCTFIQLLVLIEL